MTTELNNFNSSYYFSWDTYVNLEATVKNMLTSLRAVGELQNPAIRERHWDQLMRSTKVTFLGSSSICVQIENCIYS